MLRFKDRRGAGNAQSDQMPNFPANKWGGKGKNPNMIPIGKKKVQKPQKKITKKRPLGSRIRDLRRLLNKESLPAEVRTKKERELQQLEEEKSRSDEQRKTNELYKQNYRRYKMVRFFELQKTNRRLEKLKKQKKAGESSEGIDEQISKAEKDILYITNFPKDEKYIALYPKDGHRPEAIQRMSAIRARIDREVLEGVSQRTLANEQPSQSEPTRTKRPHRYIQNEEAANPQSDNIVHDDFFVDANDEGGSDGSGSAAEPEDKGEDLPGRPHASTGDFDDSSPPLSGDRRSGRRGAGSSPAQSSRKPAQNRQKNAAASGGLQSEKNLASKSKGDRRDKKSKKRRT